MRESKKTTTNKRDRATVLSQAPPPRKQRQKGEKGPTPVRLPPNGPPRLGTEPRKT